MVFCENRVHGCSRSFSTRYGMKIHLRSCVSGTTESRVTESPRTRKRTYEESMLLERTIAEAHVTANISNYNQDTDPIAPFQELIEAQDLGSIANIRHKENSLFTQATSEENKAVALLKLKLGRLGRATSQKEVDEIINILSLPSFRLEEFITSCSGYNDCRLQEDSILENSLNLIGFKKITLTDPVSNICCDMYLRSPLEVLRNQIGGASKESCFFEPPESTGEFNHPMMADLGQQGVTSITKAIMSSSINDTLWHNGLSAMESSFVGLIQIYSDKSKTSLKESAFQLYPLHVTLLNFHDDYKRKCIMNGSTFVAFLPVSFYKTVEGMKHPASVERPQKLRLIHSAIDNALDDIRKFGYTGFSCKDVEGLQRLCHPCLVSYCCDLPESKDLSSVRNGNSSEKNCHRCLAASKEFNLYTRCSHRAGKDTVEIIQRARKLRSQGKRDEADSLMDEYSLRDQIPSLSNMPFLDLHATLDMHYIFTFEPLHGFDLGISRELKKCLSQRLRSETLLTNNLPTKGGIYRLRTFKSVRMIILNGINSMLSHIQETSPAKGLRVDFSSTCKGESGNGLFGKEGKLIGMLEGKDYRSVDMILPFIGMYADRCCGEESTAVTTKVYVQYVDIMQTAMCYKGSPHWSDDRVKDLERKIQRFKTDARELFAQHQKSKLRTEKFHMLDHIGEDIRRMGGIRFGDAGVYEYTHTLVKKAYKSGSKRRQSAMDETVLLFLKEMNYSALHKLFYKEHGKISEGSSDNRLRIKTASKEAISTDCAALVKNGKPFTLTQLIRCRLISRKLRKAYEMGKEEEVTRLKALRDLMNNVATDIVQDVGEEGCRVLCAQLSLKCEDEGEESRPTNSRSISRVASGYVPGIETPLGKDFDARTRRLMVKPSAARYSQRMVSGRGFYGRSSLRQDCVVIQGDDGNSTNQICLWVAKVLLMLRLPSSSSGNDGDNLSEEYVFIQYFDTQPYEDEIDKTLGCVKLVWARDETAEEQNSNSARKWFDLLPVTSIRGVVHVVRGDYGTAGKGVTKDIRNVPWYEQRFFVNRFYVCNESQRYDHVDIEED